MKNYEYKCWHYKMFQKLFCGSKSFFKPPIPRKKRQIEKIDSRGRRSVQRLISRLIQACDKKPLHKNNHTTICNNHPAMLRQN
jgi:hypothetical protein